MHHNLLPIIFVAVFTSLPLSASPTAKTCSSQAEFNQAYDQQDYAKLREFSHQIDSCNQNIKDRQRYFIADALYDELTPSIQAETATIQDYDEILNIHPFHWRTLIDVAELSLDVGDYQGALDSYENAFIGIDGAGNTPIEVKIPSPYILDIKDKADNARLLASLIGYVEPKMPRDKQGKPIGMYNFSPRGVSIPCHKYPIQFNYDDFSIRGNDLKNIKLLYKVLHANGDPDIYINGHTDYKGSEEYNLLLSQKRAKAVETYLLDKFAYKGKIKAIGKGESEAVRMNSNRRKKLDDHKWRQINRRVETCTE